LNILLLLLDYELRMIFLGDIHGDHHFAKSIATRYPKDKVIQVGDFGVGFISSNELNENFPDNLYFFCGNHDKRREAPMIKGYMGDFGEFDDIFFVSGADSIDKDWRTPEVNWWEDEELNCNQMKQCLEAWERSDKNILVAHDIPQSFAEYVYKIYDNSATRNLLQVMIEVRKPKIVVAGHHHKSITGELNGIKYRGIDINEVYEIEPELLK